jgi:hypothetical protein
LARPARNWTARKYAMQDRGEQVPELIHQPTNNEILYHRAIAMELH